MKETKQESETITLYRLVRSENPHYEDAKKGIARPRGGGADHFDHILGDTSSPYTSWTDNKEYLKTMFTAGFVILAKKFYKADTKIKLTRHETPYGYPQDIEYLAEGEVRAAHVFNSLEELWEWLG